MQVVERQALDVAQAQTQARRAARWRSHAPALRRAAIDRGKQPLDSSGSHAEGTLALLARADRWDRGAEVTGQHAPRMNRYCRNSRRLDETRGRSRLPGRRV